MNHPNFEATQEVLDATSQGQYEQVFESFADDIVVVNGPGAGPWHRAENKDEFALLLLEFAASFGDTFHQEGRCVYADDRVAISLIHETGTAPSGDVFDNMAVYVSRLTPDGKSDRLSTFDLDEEHCLDFWRRNPGSPSKDFA